MKHERTMRAHPGVQRWAAALAALAVAVVLSGCGQDTVTRTIAITTPGGGAGFSPTTMTVDKGDMVVLTVNNTTGAQHGFSIAGQDVTEIVDAGVTAEIRFSANRAGTFRIFCQLHEGHQTATLTVR